MCIFCLLYLHLHSIFYVSGTKYFANMKLIFLWLKVHKSKKYNNTIKKIQRSKYKNLEKNFTI